MYDQTKRVFELRSSAKRFAASIGIALIALACGATGPEDPGTGAPSAGFTQDATEGGPGLVVQFSDTSTGNVTTYAWDFGVVGTSSERNPRVQFDDEGIYSVRLTVSGAEGFSVFDKPMLVTVRAPEEAGVATFETDRRTGGAGLTVMFSNTSAGDLTSYEWDFGAAGTSSERDPTVVFTDVGQYTVKLTVMGSAGLGVVEKENYITVRAPEEAGVASFTADRTAGGPGLVVQFTDTSLGEPTTHDWDFGNAGTSSERNPVVVFEEVGQYTVKLTVDGAYGFGISEKILFITVRSPIEAGVAQFDADKTEGAIGLSVQFEDQSTADSTSWAWDFGAAGTSSERNPSVVFPAAGLYSVTLTVTGSGGLSTLAKTDFIKIYDIPTAGFTCTPSTKAFAPVTRTCQDESVDATSWLWNFGDGSSCFYTNDSELSIPDGISLCASRNPVHTYESQGQYVIQQTATGPSGSDTYSITTAAGVLEIFELRVTGPAAPVDVVFFANPNGVAANFYFWMIDGAAASLSASVFRRFKYPGSYSIDLFAENASIPTQASTTLQFVVEHAPPTADFASGASTGTGPLEVQFEDESTGALDSWLWDFGDGTSCFHATDPALSPPGSVPDCGSSSPEHEYEEVGAYDVTLTVTGPEFESGPDTITSTRTREHHVHVSIMDASFELQAVNGKISGAWTHLRPTSPTQDALHRALSEAQGADIGMPSDGQKWASLDGQGTDGSVAVENLENGIQQDFLYPPGSPVLEFDYTFLYSEPPASQNFDEIVATVSDGVTTLVIPSSVADTSTAYAGQSLRFPTRDNSIVRSTPRHTASINLADSFPGSDSLTRFTLTIRTGNAENDRRSPRAFVDNIRFTEPADPTLPVEFSLESLPVFANQAAHFVDETCAQPEDACAPPSSWRWDFGTHESATAPSASGSGDQNPAYIFEEAGEYEVELVARLADAEGAASMMVTVIDNPVASFEITPEEPYIAPATIEFRDTSTVDPSDTIETWSWDFAGWGESSLQNPAPFNFEHTGEWTVRLTVTTESGVETSADLTVAVE